MDGTVVVQSRRVTHGFLPARVVVVDLLLRGGIDRAMAHRHRPRDPGVTGSVVHKRHKLSTKGTKKCIDRLRLLCLGLCLLCT